MYVCAPVCMCVNELHDSIHEPSLYKMSGHRPNTEKINKQQVQDHFQKELWTILGSSGPSASSLCQICVTYLSTQRVLGLSTDSFSSQQYCLKTLCNTVSPSKLTLHFLLIQNEKV